MRGYDSMQRNRRQVVEQVRNGFSPRSRTMHRLKLDLVDKAWHIPHSAMMTVHMGRAQRPSGTKCQATLRMSINFDRKEDGAYNESRKVCSSRLFASRCRRLLALELRHCTAESYRPHHQPRKRVRPRPYIGRSEQ